MSRSISSGRTGAAIGRLACIAFAVAGTLAPSASLGQSASAKTGPTLAPQVAADTFGGRVVHDPFRHAESPNEPAVRAWWEAHRARTQRVLDASAVRNDAGRRIARFLNGPVVSVPVARGPRLFFQSIDVDSAGGLVSSRGALRVATSAEDSGRVVLDPRRLPDVGIAGWSVDPRGDLVAVHLGANGAVVTSVRVVSAMSGEFVAEQLERVLVNSVSWLPSGKAFVYTRVDSTVRSQPYRTRVRLHEVGTPNARDRDIFVPTESGVATGFAVTDRRVFLTLPGPAPSAAPWIGYQAPIAVRSWMGYADNIGGSFSAIITVAAEVSGSARPIGARRDSIWVLVTDSAQNSRVEAGDLGAGVWSPRVVFAPKTGVIRDAVIAGKGVVAALDDGLRGSLVYVEGGTARELPLPGPGPVTQLSGSLGDSRIYYRHSTYLRRAPVYEQNLREGRWVSFRNVGPGLDPKRFVEQRVELESADGTRVPMFVVHRRDLQRDGTGAALLYAYGAWGWKVEPWYHQRWVAWLDAGGVLAVAGVRGGGEYGQPWHDAGRRERRQGAIDDIHAAAAWLHRNGYSSPNRTGLLGLSAGGPTVASALLQKPELFGAAVLEVALFDVVRFGARQEFGDPSRADELDWVIKYSPYHNLTSRCYPAILVATSDDDAALGQSLKFFAQLQRVQTCERNLLLHIGAREGHLPAGRLGERRHINELTFLLGELVGNRE